MNATGRALHAVSVELTIPDNAALTALETLRRLGVPIGGLERADIYRVAIDDDADAASALGSLRDVEVLFNPNKHRWSERTPPRPATGELWTCDLETSPADRVFGRRVGGIASFEAFVAWRVRDTSGSPADARLVRRAAEMLLCNFAFQRIEN